MRGVSEARFGSLVARGVRAVSHDLDDLTTGFWVVAVTFEGELTAVRMDDVRVQHRLMQVADVDTKPLAGLIGGRPKLPLILLNALATIRGPELARIAAGGNVYVDISMLEGITGVSQLAREVPVERILFGSHLPLFDLESAALKMRESELTAAETAAIAHGNARRVLAGRT